MRHTSSYRVYYCLHSQPEVKAHKDVDQMSNEVIIDGLRPGSTYIITVASMKGTIISEQSPPEGIKIKTNAGTLFSGFEPLNGIYL